MRPKLPHGFVHLKGLLGLMLRRIVMSRALRTNATTTSAIADTDTLREWL
jgi:hypothetical protein